MTAGVLVAAVPIGLLATNILVVNNYRDAETDAAAKKRTLVVRFGRGAARAQFNVSLALAFLMPIAFVVAERSFWCALPCALAPTMWRHARRLEESKSPSELIELLGDTGRLLAFYAVLFSAGLVL
jgi:1,4-dihydroxy-2-naphthoate octaprenyltransferase